jgi:hypothetical protein
MRSWHDDSSPNLPTPLLHAIAIALQVKNHLFPVPRFRFARIFQANLGQQAVGSAAIVVKQKHEPSLGGSSHITCRTNRFLEWRICLPPARRLRSVGRSSARRSFACRKKQPDQQTENDQHDQQGENFTWRHALVPLKRLIRGNLVFLS